MGKRDSTAAPEEPLARGERIWLRGYREDDLAAYEEFVNSRAGQRAGYSIPQSPANVREFYEKRVVAQHGKDAYFFAVSPLGSAEFVGTTWVWNYDSRLGGPELSIFMLPKTWGTGLGTDAVNATLDRIYGFTALDRIWLATEADNERAQRSFEKSGFQREGVIRHYAVVQGRPVDAVLMAMVRSDWGALDRPRSWDL